MTPSIRNEDVSKAAAAECCIPTRSTIRASCGCDTVLPGSAAQPYAHGTSLARNPLGSGVPAADTVTTTILISNLHCSSCCTTIRQLLTPLTPPPLSVSTNILTQEVTIVHLADLSTNELLRVLLEAEFEVDSISVVGPAKATSSRSGVIITNNNSNDGRSGERFLLEEWGDRVKTAFEAGKKRRKHAQLCELCRAKGEKQALYRCSSDNTSPYSLDAGTTATVGKGDKGFMPGPSIVSSRSGEMSLSNVQGGCREADALPILHSDNCNESINMITSLANHPAENRSTTLSPSASTPLPSGIGRCTPAERNSAMAPSNAALEKKVVGVHEKSISSNMDLSRPQNSGEVNRPLTALFEATFSIEGMTCSACTGKVNETIEGLAGVRQVNVALMTNSATVRFEGTKELAAKIVDEIESIGYGCALDSIKEVGNGTGTKSVERTVHILIDGMFCGACPTRVLEALSSFGDNITVNKPPTIADPTLEITYLPVTPDFTIRRIISEINATNPAFFATIHHPPTIEERSRHIQRTELRRLLIRLLICFIIAIPTFMIGIVWMSLVPKDDQIRRYFEEPMWAGRASRLEWVLFFLSTPVQFFIADVFHKRAYKEIKALWRRHSTVPILRRFYRFGSMNLLISLGVSIAYFASVGLLATAATSPRDSSAHHTTYFDSTVFLTLFLLIGRCLEAYSKSKTADAVSMLGKLRPTEALLLVEGSSSPSTCTEGALSEKPAPRQTIQKVPVDMLEVGDTILVQSGGSPPADGKIVIGETKFDESSLTGEAKPVMKVSGDSVYAGTINRGRAVHVLVDAINGESMLDQIVKVVREGQTRRAPIERVADVITGYFVPVITLIAILTWVIWLSLGMSGTLPDYYLDVDDGGWPVWSLGFAIAVFVVACPCGIGLAAPTALFVGSGLAAKYGILAKGGGEAFQEASGLDCIVFDKTGTLTEGGEPKVTDERLFMEECELIYAVIAGLEEMSSHPLARALVRHCAGEKKVKVAGCDIEEVAGRGLKGTFTVEGGQKYHAIIGNESFMTEHDVAIVSDETNSLLHRWKSEGKSVVLLAMDPFPNRKLDIKPGFVLSAIFAAADPLRPEALSVVSHLKSLGISIWMISGDNPTTAVAVAKQVGIPSSNVIAGVLPTEKATHVQRLQQTISPRRRNKKKQNKAVIAMVGDGINDAPALTVADVGIAIGSGADVAVSSAEFVLVNGDLEGVVRLVELSRVVLNRIRWNFAWACVYNIIAVPVAAGVLYPVGMASWKQLPPQPEMDGHEMDMNSAGSGGKRIRLEPVWASLAMAHMHHEYAFFCRIWIYVISFCEFRLTYVRPGTELWRFDIAFEMISFFAKIPEV